MSCSTVLKEKGYRLTPQRRLILDILHQQSGHLTAEDIYAKIKDRLAGINISTVYRTLDLLENLGLVVRSEYDNGHIYHHAQVSHHHHLLCNRCGRITECSEELLAGLAKKVKQKYGFEADLHHHVFTGICDDCRKATRQG